MGEIPDNTRQFSTKQYPWCTRKMDTVHPSTRQKRGHFSSCCNMLEPNVTAVVVYREIRPWIPNLGTGQEKFCKKRTALFGPVSFLLQINLGRDEYGPFGWLRYPKTTGESMSRNTFNAGYYVYIGTMRYYYGLRTMESRGIRNELE